VLRNGERKENEGDYRLDNLWACVQSGIDIRKEHRWNTMRRRRDSAETHNRPKAFALVFVNLSCVGWSSSSSLAKTVRLGVGERRRSEIAIGHLSDRGPRRLPVSVVECSRPLTATRVSAVKLPHFNFNPTEKPVLRVPRIFLFFFFCVQCDRDWALNVRGSSGEATRRSDIGLGKSSDARPLAN